MKTIEKLTEEVKAAMAEFDYDDIDRMVASCDPAVRSEGKPRESAMNARVSRILADVDTETRWEVFFRAGYYRWLR